MMLRALLLAAMFAGGAGGSEPSASAPIRVYRDGVNLRLEPRGDFIVDAANFYWSNFDQQSSPTPHIAEGLVTLYGYSELAYGNVSIRAAEYERRLALGLAVQNERMDFLVRLRDGGPENMRAGLRAAGYAGVIALKADDVGRDGFASFWDAEQRVWLPPVRVIVLDALGGGWERLRRMWHPFDGGPERMRWLGDVSKDMLEDVGLGRLVENNWSTFMRLRLDGAAARDVRWPDYSGGSE